MSVNNKYKKDIIRYLNREMPNRERENFEKELDNNSLLFEELMKLMVTVNEKEKLKDIYRQVVQEQEPAKTRSLNRVYLAAAAVIIILVAIGSLFFINLNSTPDSLLTAENLEYPSPYSFRNGESSDTVAKLAAHRKFNDAEFQQAADLFEKIIFSDKNDEESHFYYALSLLKTKEKSNLKQSVKTFESLLTSDRFGQQSHYFIALALYESGQREKAKPYFKKIIDEGWSFEGKAKVILSDNY